MCDTAIMKSVSVPEIIYLATCIIILTSKIASINYPQFDFISSENSSNMTHRCLCPSREPKIGAKSYGIDHQSDNKNNAVQYFGSAVSLKNMSESGTSVETHSTPLEPTYNYATRYLVTYLLTIVSSHLLTCCGAAGVVVLKILAIFIKGRTYGHFR